MALFYFLSVIAIALLPQVLAHGGHLMEHERRDEHDFSTWSKGDRLDKRTILPVRIGLTQSNLDNGYDLLMDVSHPSSKNYGKYYTTDQIIDLFAPSDDTVKTVRLWLESEGGIDNKRVSLSENKQWLQFDAPISELEDLLKTTYHHYQHSETDAAGIGCDLYHLPAHVRRHIDYVTPGVKRLGARVSQTHTKRSAPEPPRTHSHSMATNLRRPPGLDSAFANNNCHHAVTPKCIRKLYNVTDTIKKAQPGNSLGIYESVGDYLNQRDMNTFYENLAPYIPKNTFPIVRRIDGAPNPKVISESEKPGRGPESALDFQAAYPLAWPDKLVLYQVDDVYWESKYPRFFFHMYNGIFNNFLDAIDGSYCNFTAFGIRGNTKHVDPHYPHKGKKGYKGKLQCGKFKPTKVLSFSYGGPEAFYPVNYLKRQCVEFMKLGMQGITILAASGDYGVAPRARSSNKRLPCLGPNHDKFGSITMADCPYITSVGGTYLPKGNRAGEDPEWGDYLSGGGFSNIFPRAKYQEQAVETYFKNHSPPYPFYKTVNHRLPPKNAGKGLYNRAGRAVPDVSANSDKLGIYYYGKAITIGGTSEATPIWAGLISRINNARLAAGKSTVGFINPVLYEHPHVLRDIRHGHNPGCGTRGFNAVEGWDPITGLGTPDYGKMKELWLRLP